MQEEVINWKARAEAAEARAEAAEARIVKLEAKLNDLLARLEQDSSNSHRPPSSDFPGRKRRRRTSGKKSSGRKPGGQPGHKGHHRVLLPSEQVDKIIDLSPTSCLQCGAQVGEEERVGKPLRFQQMEIPPIKPIVTEYRAYQARCSCGQLIERAKPQKEQTWCTGPRLMAIIASLSSLASLGMRQQTFCPISSESKSALEPCKLPVRGLHKPLLLLLMNWQKLCLSRAVLD